MNFNTTYPRNNYLRDHGTCIKREEDPLKVYMALLQEQHDHEPEVIANTRQSLQHLEAALELLASAPSCPQMESYNLKPITSDQMFKIAFSGHSHYPADIFSKVFADQSVSIETTAAGNQSGSRIYEVKIQINGALCSKIYRSLPMDLHDLVMPLYDDALTRHCLFGCPLSSLSIPSDFTSTSLDIFEGFGRRGVAFQIIKKSFYPNKLPIYETVVDNVDGYNVDKMATKKFAMKIVNVLVEKDRVAFELSQNSLVPDYHIIREHKNNFSARIRNDEICKFVWLTPQEWCFIPEVGGAYVVGVLNGLIVEAHSLTQSIRPGNISKNDMEIVTDLFCCSDEVVVGIFNGESTGCNRFFPTATLSHSDYFN